MIHTVYIDDATTAGKRFLRDFSRVRKGIIFENPAVTGKIPEGYMTRSEFVEGVMFELEKKLINNGCL
ncbi:MAG: hypothetical protein LBS08_02615 [Candidatus Symbiothrix sp.]|jgi:hypothetical protein|nr:hypothetical protein [Candidatus Symbiothrix sp.]